MRKILAFLLLSILCLSSLTSIPVSAKSSKVNSAARVEYYNAKNKLIAVKTSKVATPTKKLTYQFGKTYFNNYIWIKKGSAFKKPGKMKLQLNKKTKQFEVRMYASNNKRYIGKAVFKNASGWVSFDWKLLRKKDASYSFKLVSAANSGRIIINKGFLEYNVR
ncbi:hypothetical protein [Bacillus changyiensis]|uniref:hypothetical protein n=1 Tax=Bacillus changyiensis TaxID=3004103 RepID=UPI0022E4DA2D|nr:hypothetical protein [Bacillus changyiensis]MDA1478392.1 hypothetical protein [Bacillus changyiensis]